MGLELAPSGSAYGPINQIRLREAARIVEWTYVVVLLLALTQGPVLSIWLRSTQPGQVDPNQAIAVTYLALQIPAIALLTRRGLRWSDRRVFLTSLYAVIAWFMLSTIWSSVRATTATAAVAFAATSLVGLYLARSWSLVQLITLVFVAMQPGLIASEWAIRRRWIGSVYFGVNPPWHGIYFNRNSLGPPAVVGTFAGCMLIAHLIRSRPRWWPPAAIVVAAFLVFDLRMQRGSRSATSWIVLTAAVLTWLIWAGFAVLRRRRAFRAIDPGRAAVAYLAAVVVLWVLAVIESDRVSAWFGRPPGFNDRVDYWSASIEGVKVHPARGWGWLAAWNDPNFKARLEPPMNGDIWSHSAYLDVLLGGGIIVGLIFAIVLVSGFAAAGRTAVSDPVIGAWCLSMAIGVSIAATEESFFIGNHFYWAIVVAAFAYVPVASRVPAVAEEFESDADPVPPSLDVVPETAISP